MDGFTHWRWSAMAIALGLGTSVARAEMITPDSIPNPPTTVSSANGTNISASNIVSTQYAGMGLNLGAAITNLSIPVWAPIGFNANPPNISGIINYAFSMGGSFVLPNSSNPTTVTSLSVDIVARPGTFPLPLLSMHVYGLNGQTLNISPTIGLIANSQVWMFSGPGISSFSISPSSSSDTAWGVASISFTPTTPTVPEPSSLLLAGLGVLGVAVRRFRWRRVRAVA